jgi:hypothetical protein
MSQTPSKKMLALNAVLLAVLLVSLPLQVRAYWPDAFANAFGQWVGCNTGWYDCTWGCGSSSDPGYWDCRTACNSVQHGCWGAINWPDFELDYCAGAQAAYNECQTERANCLSAGIDQGDCIGPFMECADSSGIWSCQ